MRCHSCGPVTHHLSLCHVLFTQVSALRIANLVSGASGVPAWRRTKRVGLGKDRSRGPACPFCRSKAQTPRWPLHPHRPVPLKQRKRSALWPKKCRVGEVNAQFEHSKHATLKTTYARNLWMKETRLKIVTIRWRYSDFWKIAKSMWFMKCDDWWRHYSTSQKAAFLPVHLWPTVCWLGLVWFGWAHRRILNIFLAFNFLACKQ